MTPRAHRNDAPTHPPELYAALTEGQLEHWLAERPLPGHLVEAIRYSLLAPGKRLRPRLVLHGCAAVDGPIEVAVPAAAAIEMVHAFSLVHDDLPAMDDGDLRRGRPTLHRKTSEAMALLAGDAMFGLAIELVLERIEPTELALGVARELVEGSNAMIAGQVYDTLPRFPASVDPRTRLETIHRHKTGALIRAACRMGGLCGGADERQLAALTTYGEHLGLMFQVVDDLLDVTQSTEHLGKTAGRDREQDKWTYPVVLGLQGTRDEIGRLERAALEALRDLGPGAEPLRELCHRLTVRTR